MSKKKKKHYSELVQKNWTSKNTKKFKVSRKLREFFLECVKIVKKKKMHSEKSENKNFGMPYQSENGEKKFFLQKSWIHPWIDWQTCPPKKKGSRSKLISLLIIQSLAKREWEIINLVSDGFNVKEINHDDRTESFWDLREL